MKLTKSTYTKRSYHKTPYKKASYKKRVYKKKAFFKKVKPVVERILTRQAETKIQTYSVVLQPSSLQNGTTSLSGNYLVLNPSNSAAGYSITQGTGPSNMIGNKIRTKKCTLALVMTPNNYNASTNAFITPVTIRMYVYRYKLVNQFDPNVGNLCTAGTANFFENGATYDGFGGTLMDMNKHIQKDSYVYYTHRDFKLGPATPMTAGAPGTPDYQVSNNDYKLGIWRNLNVTKYLPKIATIDDSGNWQQTRIIMLFQVLPASQVATGAFAPNTTLPVTIDVRLQYNFQDY